MPRLAPRARSIALLGMAGRFPGADDVESFMDNLEAGVDSVGEVPADRWDNARWYSPDRNTPGRTVSKWLGAIDGVDRFDARMFGLSPRTAEAMDPQQRLLLEVAWHCLEDAGVSPARLAEARTAVFVGAMATDYLQVLADRRLPVDAAAAINAYGFGLANRLSHVLGLSGQSHSVDAACASSLVALHQARRALLAGECDFALVGAVSVNLDPWRYVAFSQAGMLSPTGRCHSFDITADGYVPGDGVVAVLLRRHADARRDGDRVRALLRGSAAGHGGATGEISHPSARAQARIIAGALADAGLVPRDIDYVEAHGTGTSLGDPIEVAGLNLVFGKVPGPIALGSVKSNIGHLEAAAGLAGVVKVTQMMQRRQWVPTVQLTRPNPIIPFEDGPLRPLTHGEPWRKDTPRIAGISSFGVGGANAHVVLQEAPPPRPSRRRIRGALPILLSARDPQALQALLDDWRTLAHSDRFAALPLADIAGGLAVGRAALRCRVGTIAGDHDGLRAWLDTLAPPLDAPAPPTRWVLGFGHACRGIHPSLRFLQQLGLRPDAVTGWGDGVDVAARLARRERLPLLDPRDGARPGEARADVHYLRRLQASARRFHDASRSPLLERPLATGRDLLPHQHSFRRLVEGWNEALAPLGLDPVALVEQGPAADGDGRLLAGTIVVDALRRLGRKWNLALVDDPALAPLLSLSMLLEAEVLTPPAVITLLLGEDGAPERWASQRRLPAALPQAGDRHAAVVDDRSRGVPPRAAWTALGAPAFDEPGLVHVGGGSQHALRLLALELWRRGADIDWRAVFPLADFARVSLPRYPFQRQSFRIGRRALDEAAPAAAPANEAAVQVYRPRWEPVPASDAPVGATTLLRRSLDDGADTAALMERMDATTGPLAVAFAWPDQPPGSPEAMLDGPMRRLFEGAAAVNRRADAARCTMLFTSPTDAGPVVGGLLAGFAASLAMESPCAIAAVECAPDAPLQTVLPLPLQRHGRRLRMTNAGVERLALVADTVPAAGAAPVQPDAVAIVTGGGGVIGRHCAALLAKQGWRKIALFGRSLGSTSLASPGPPGAEVRGFACDVADADALAAVLAQVRGWGPVGAVVHGAGVLDDGLLIAQPWPAARAVLAPKLLGAMHLDALTADDPLALFVAHASVVGIVGNAAQTAYAAANGALQGVVDARIARGAPGRAAALAWGLWRDGGMGDAATAAAFERAGLPPLTAAGATPVLDAALAGGVEGTLAILGGPLAMPADAAAAAPTATAASPAAATPAQARSTRDAISRLLRERIAAMTGEAPERLGQHDTLFDMGLGSLEMQSLTAELGRRFANVTPTLLFSHTSIAALSEYLAAQPMLDTPAVATGDPVTPRADPDNEPPAAAADPREQPIAIIGMSGRFPQAPDLWAFWDNLDQGRDCVGPVPAERWERALGQRPPGAAERPRWGGFIDGVDRFDPLFFNISVREAERMDPQQRLVLENAWHTLEHAGYGQREAHAGRAVGVFVGTMWGEYSLYAAEQGYLAGAYGGPGSLHWQISNRVSYHFDFHGPSLTVDTACSSSLTAIHLACQALRAGDCEMALAGGVNLSLHPAKYDYLQEGRFLSSDGRCRSFGAGGDGYVPGEGVASVLLKPLSAAVADGDRIYGVVLGSAVNHGGRAAGFTAPNPDAQQALAERALQRAGVSPQAVGYVECHGTGTALGDPIEIAALSAVHAGRDSPLPIGSVKSSIGHLEAAAGVAGLIKVLLALEYRRLPPNLHAEPANPAIDFAGGPFRVVREAQPWPLDNAPRIAELSSFGAGGANAHAVIAGPEFAARVGSSTGGAATVTVSARSRDGLAALCRRLAERVGPLRDPSLGLPDVAATLAMRPVHEFAVRLQAGDLDELGRQLGAITDDITGGLALPPLVPAATVDTGQRCSLPGTPFEGASYWLPRINTDAPRAAPAPRLPALVAEPAGPGQWRFRLRLQADQPWLRDHQIGGAPVVAAALGLELLRQATAATGRLGSDFSLQGLAWTRAIVGDADVVIRVEADGIGLALSMEDGRGVALRGQAVPASGAGLPEVEGTFDTTLETAGFYDRLATVGMRYSGAYRSLRTLALGADGVRARIEEGSGATWMPGRVLSPVLVDGALQALLGWLATQHQVLSAVPVAIERVDWTRPLPARIEVDARIAPGPGKDLWRADLWLRDESGNACASLGGVLLQGLDPRRLTATAPAAQRSSLPEQPALAFSRLAWHHEPGAAVPAPATVAITGLDGTATVAVLAAWPDRGALAWDGHDTTAAEAAVIVLAAAPEAGWQLRLAAILQRIVTAAAPTRVLIVAAAQDPQTAALGGLLRSLRREQPALDARLLMTDGDPSALASAAARELARARPRDPELRLVDGHRQMRAEETLDAAGPAGAADLGGAWLVTGGLGGLGLQLAQRLLERGASGIALVGRNADRPDAAQAAALAALERFGVPVMPLAADVTDAVALRAAVQHAAADLGPLAGVVHAAGVTRDSLLRGKDLADMATVLEPKLAGTVALDEATADQPLRWFVLFSSISGVRGNLGQTDYAYANRFLDLFAEAREQRRVAGARSGRSIAIDWPLWLQGGLQVDARTRDWLRESLGTEALEMAQGLDAFERALVLDAPQVLVTVPVVRRAEIAPRQLPATATAALRPRVQGHLLALLATTTKIPAERLDSRRPVDDYGVDSVLAVEMVQSLERDFGQLSRVLFYEHPTLDAVADHLLAHRGDAVRAHFDAAAPTTTAALRHAATPPLDVHREATPSPAADDTGDEPIAVIGLAGRYPHAPDLDAFWRNLLAGHDAIGPVPASRWAATAQGGTTHGHGLAGGFLDDIDAFDPLLFGIAPKDARLMDPQARLFLEGALAALEDGGYAGMVDGSAVGVFVAAMWGQYELLGAGVSDGPVPNSSFAEIANRVSHAFGLTGPSLAVDSMCSGSLTALHLACESIRRGECAMALAGGANLSLRPEKYRQLIEGNFLSSDGRCRSFGEGGDGYVPGEGVGVALLKPLRRALADGDAIWGVIGGSAINHGGRAKGYTVPNPHAQAAVIRSALQRSGLAAADIDYVEAHGTGTSLGDPIELAGIAAAFGGDTTTPPATRWRIGSVKSQIGHCEAAAGIAGLTKVLLQLRAGQFAPSLHAEPRSSAIDWERQPFELVTRAEPWLAAGNGAGTRPRRAVVSSFGAGGSNAHLVVEQAPVSTAPASIRTPGRPVVVSLSARTDAALRSTAAALARALEDSATAPPDRERLRALLAEALGVPTAELRDQDALADLGLDAVTLERFLHSCAEAPADAPRRHLLVGAESVGALLDRCSRGDASATTGPALGDIAFTLAVGRLALPERLCLVVDSLEELRSGLLAFAQGAALPARALSGRAGTGADAVAATATAAATMSTRDAPALARAWVNGAEVDWRAWHGPDSRRIRLPGTVLERKSYWFAPEPTAAGFDDAATTARWRKRAADYQGDAVTLSLQPDGIAVVTMNAPASHNMFDDALALGLVRAFEAAGADERTRVVVVAGGDEVFSMGGTPEMLQAIANGEASFTDVPFFYRGLLECPLPVITAIAGHAYGGGLLFGLYADIPVLAEESLYSAVFADYGFSPGMGATLILPERLGTGLATEMMYTARAMTGAELRTRAAPVRVCPRAEVLAQAMELARNLAAKPRGTLMAMKQNLARSLLERLPAAIGEERAMHAETFTTDEVRAGLARRFASMPGAATLDASAPTTVRLRATRAPARIDDTTGTTDTGARLAAAPGARVRLRPTGAAARPPVVAATSPPAVPHAVARPPTAAGTAITDRLAGMVARLLQMDPGDLAPDLSLTDQGLDSIGAVELVRAINAAFGLRLEVTELYDHPSIARLAVLVGQRTPSETAVPPAPEPTPAPVPLIARAAPAPDADRPAVPTPRPADDDVAVIGMACRYPGADDVARFWRNQLDALDAVTEIPPERWDGAALHDADPQASGRSVSRWGGFLGDVAGFDADFFRISPMEAEIMDPQQRIALEQCWHALEDAGLAPDRLAGSRCGVFMGGASGDYESLLARAGVDLTAEAFTGLAPSILAARIAYHLDLTGPALSIDTACSSSLVAVHQARRALLAGDCDLALAGGVMVMATPRLMVKSSSAGMLSPTGRCRPFSAAADGIALAEGAGVVVLKRLADARRDGDPVCAVIRASGINQDGRTNGITAPSARSQSALLRQVYAEAGIAPASIGYVEAHGTGTSLGDPIEFKALCDVFAGVPAASCVLGSAKANIGHATVAAGVAGLITAVQAVRSGDAPPLLHSGVPNPRVGLDGSPFRIGSERTRWGGAGPRRAAASSFGFSGTNAHVVVEQAPHSAGLQQEPLQPLPFLLSAHTADALDAVRSALAKWLRGEGADASLRDVALTLATGRAALGVRWAAVVQDRGALLRALDGDAAASPDDRWDALCRAWLGGGKPLPPTELQAIGGRRISLPGYPFEHRRFWVTDGAAAIPVADARPLLAPDHRRITLAADDPLLRDHRRGHGDDAEPLLAGAAYLAIALAGCRPPGQSATHVALSDVYWLLPMSSAQCAAEPRLRTDGDPHAAGSFEVLSGSGRAEDLHARGQFAIAPATAPAPVDVARLQAQCTRVVAASSLHAAFATRGLQLSGRFRQLAGMRCGADQVLGELRPLPGTPHGDPDPGLLDSALQCVAALVDPTLAGESQYLPVSLAHFRVHERLGEARYSWVRDRGGERGRNERSFDVDILARDGRVLAEFREFTLRRVSPQATAGVQLLEPRWRPLPLPAVGASDAGVVTVGHDRVAADPDRPMLWIPDVGPASRLFADTVEQVRALASQRREHRLTIAVGSEAAARALTGFALSLALEQPWIRMRVVWLDGVDAADPRLRALAAATTTPVLGRLDPTGFAHLDYVRRAAPPSEASPALDGTWLITGGLGRLGLKVAAHLARRGARVALLARSAPSAEAKQALQAIAAQGHAPMLRWLDLCDTEALARTVVEVCAEAGPIHGVVHAAGVLRDALLDNKRDPDWQAVLAAKVDVAERLAAALRGQPLQAFACFTSVAALKGQLGQTDYAFANGWLDGLASDGATPWRAIAWPWWREGGMPLAGEAIEHARATLGIEPLETDDGLAAFDAVLAGDARQTLVVPGESRRLLAALAPSSEARGMSPMHAAAIGPGSGDVDDTAKRIAWVQLILGELVAELLKVDRDRIGATRPFADYGFESITLTRFATRINRRLGLDLSPAVFFEAGCIGELAALVVARHADALPTPMAVPAPVADTSMDAATAASIPVAAPSTATAPEPIAIIGMDGRFPGGGDLATFWQHLAAGDDLVTEIPAERWDWRAFQPPASAGQPATPVRWGGFLDDVARFDARFFGISPREAELIDPQQRLFLETAWRAIEDAGIRPGAVAGSNTGVFVGIATADYMDLMLRNGANFEGHAATGLSHGMLPNRISFLLDLHGPSEPVDTSCSSSMVALARAVEAIRRGDCDMAIAGGVNLLLSPTLYLAFGQAGMLSPNGRCRSFDAAADGYVRGEGVGAVLLKPLSRALADGDPIHGVIRGVGVAHGGRAHSLTAPNPNAQGALIAAVLARAGVDAATVDYVETHGTGTPLGDPVEIAGLAQAFARAGGSADRSAPCALGALKSNIGHLEAAAGIAGLVKVLLALRHRQLPGNVHFDRLNPHIRLEGTPFEVLSSTRPWPAPRGPDGAPRPRRAGLSSFGFGGVNVHALIEQAPGATLAEPVEDGPQLIVLSARSKTALHAQAAQLCGHLAQAAQAAHADVEEAPATLSLPRLAYTLQLGREAHPHRLALVAGSLDDARAALASGDWLAAVVDAGATTPPAALPATRDHAAMEALAREWLAGATVDWIALHGGPRRRASLPGTVFEGGRHWAAAAACPTGTTAATRPVAVPPVPVTTPAPLHVVPDARLSDSLFAPAWIPLAGITRAVQARAPAVVLQLGGTADVLGDLQQRHDGALSPVDEASAHLGSASTLYLLDTDDSPEARTLAAQQAGEQRLLRMLQLLSRLPAEAPLDIVLLTRGATDAGGLPPTRPSAAAASAMLLSCSAERPRWRVRAVDLVDTVVRGALDTALDLPGPVARVLAGGRVLCRALQPAAPSSGAWHLPQGTVCVLLGGAGGIAGALALDFAHRAGARIALVGRRAEDDTIARRLRAIAAAGGEGVYLQADATRPDALLAALQAVTAHWAAPDLVVNATMVLCDRALADIDTTGFLSAYRAKAHPAVVLEQVLAELGQAPRVLHMSSVQSFLGNPGQANYAAGCGFLDAWAARGGATDRVVNWGYWGSVGAVADARHREAMAAAGVDSIEPDEGMAALARLLAGESRQLVMAKGTPEALARLGVVAADAEARVASGAGPGMASAVAALEAAVPAHVAQVLAATVPQPPAWEDLRGWRNALGTASPDPQLAALLDLAARGAGVAPPSLECLAREHPPVAAHVALLHAALAGLPAILRGECEGATVLLPGGSPALLEAIYAHNPLADAANARVAAHCVACARDGATRFIEIGAGTGGTSAAVLDALSPFPVDEYCYTDVSRAFTQHGWRRFRPMHPCLRAELLDVERDPLAQGFAAASFDVVIAANVLHATADVADALRRLRVLLRPGGTLVLNELTRRLDFNTATFGLLPGWWRHGDQRRLPHAPLLDAAGWQAALADAGFEAADAWNGGLGLSVLVARTSNAAVSPALGDHPADTAEMTDRLMQVFSELLRMPVSEIDPRASFNDLGVDSILAGELANRLGVTFGLALKPTELYNHPSPEKLLAFLATLAPAPAPAPAPAAAAAADSATSPAADASSVDEDSLLTLLKRLERGEISAAAVGSALERGDG